MHHKRRLQSLHTAPEPHFPPTFKPQSPHCCCCWNPLATPQWQLIFQAEKVNNYLVHELSVSLQHHGFETEPLNVLQRAGTDILDVKALLLDNNTHLTKLASQQTSTNPKESSPQPLAYKVHISNTSAPTATQKGKRSKTSPQAHNNSKRQRRSSPKTKCSPSR